MHIQAPCASSDPPTFATRPAHCGSWRHACRSHVSCASFNLTIRPRSSCIRRLRRAKPAQARVPGRKLLRRRARRAAVAGALAAAWPRHGRHLLRPCHRTSAWVCAADTELAIRCLGPALPAASVRVAHGAPDARARAASSARAPAACCSAAGRASSATTPARTRRGPAAAPLPWTWATRSAPSCLVLVFVNNCLQPGQTASDCMCQATRRLCAQPPRRLQDPQ